MVSASFSVLFLWILVIGTFISGCDVLSHGEDLLYTLSGVVYNEDRDGLEGVSLFFSDGFDSVETDEHGMWMKEGLKGTVTIVPRKEGWMFEPSSRIVYGGAEHIVFLGIKDPGIPGEEISYHVNDVYFDMSFIPRATFPTGTFDDGEAIVQEFFWLAQTPVTYELWYEVFVWAEDEGYTFLRAGREGSHGAIGEGPSENKREPVTTISWYDTIVWCNALSEFSGYRPVYMMGDEVVRDAQELAGENAHRDILIEKTDGFRLPTSMEWELAARYKGGDSSYGAVEYPVLSGLYWTPGNYASGATADVNQKEATMAAAWYSANTSKTQVVGQRPEEGNGLGIYDMSGNVWEWCFTEIGERRVARGGSWRDSSLAVRVSYFLDLSPVFSSNDYGFRVAKTKNYND